MDEEEVIRRGYEAWNRGDLDGAVMPLHEDVILQQDPGIPGAETLRGRAAVREWLGQFMDAWEDFELEPERIERAGDCLAAVLHLRATARSSGIPFDTRIAHVLWFEDGLARRWRTYTDPDEGLAQVAP